MTGRIKSIEWVASHNGWYLPQWMHSTISTGGTVDFQDIIHICCALNILKTANTDLGWIGRFFSVWNRLSTVRSKESSLSGSSLPNIQLQVNQSLTSYLYQTKPNQCQFLKSCLHQIKPNQMPTNSSRCRQPWINVKSVCGLRFCAKTTSLKKPPCSIIGFQRFSPLHSGSLTTLVAYLADKKYFLPCINHSTIEKSLPT